MEVSKYLAPRASAVRSKRGKTISIVIQGLICSGCLIGTIAWLGSWGLQFRKAPSEIFSALSRENKKAVSSRHPSGRPFSDGYLAKGRRTGVWVFRHDSQGSPVERRSTYEAGLLDGPFEAFSKEGRILARGNYLEGKKDGNWEEYWPQNGYIRSRGSYSRGKETGIWISYRADEPGATSEVTVR